MKKPQAVGLLILKPVHKTGSHVVGFSEHHLLDHRPGPSIRTATRLPPREMEGPGLRSLRDELILTVLSQSRRNPEPSPTVVPPMSCHNPLSLEVSESQILQLAAWAEDATVAELLEELGADCLELVFRPAL